MRLLIGLGVSHHGRGDRPLVGHPAHDLVVKAILVMLVFQLVDELVLIVPDLIVLCPQFPIDLAKHFFSSGELFFRAHEVI